MLCLSLFKKMNLQFGYGNNDSAVFFKASKIFHFLQRSG